MSTSISTSFVTDYISDLHVAYQQGASKLRGAVRLQTGIIGETAVFQIMGKGYAGTKTRHGLVPVMNADHSTATATMSNWYAGEYIDKLDLLKIKHDERAGIAKNGAGALGRKIDSLIITALDTTSNADTASTAGLTRNRILAGFETLNGNDVPDDGRRWGLVGPHQWNELLAIDEFANGDYIGYAELPFVRGTQVKRWMNINWMMHTGLPLGTGVRKCFIFHTDAIGWAEAQMPTVDIDWIAERHAWFFDHTLSGGAVLIDEDGVVEIDCDDDEAIA